MRKFIDVFFLIFLTRFSYGADILAIIPTASISHQLPFRPLWKELSKRGHNVTLVTTDPIRDSTLTNLKEIDMGYAYDVFEKYRVFDIAINDSASLLEKGIAIRRATNESNVMFFESPEGQNLIGNKANKFDLLLVEAQLPAMMIFSWRYKIPFIGVSSLDCSGQFHDTAGNLVHPLVTPDPNMRIENTQSLTFKERLQSFLYMWIYRFLIYSRTYPNERSMLKYYFGDDVPPLTDIQNNMSMLFVGTNPVFHALRPLMPNTITIGNGMQVENHETLSKDIKQFLDNSSEGAIYFSLGSNIKGRHLTDSVKRQLIEAFAHLPYKVLWKIDEQFDNLPENVRVEKWFKSQQNILSHPNLKLFITQGGLQSMQESLNAAKPMIGIAFFGDQYGNVKRMVELGYGLSIDKHNISKKSVEEAIEEIMNNPKFTQKALEYSVILKDVPTSNLDTAIWWTEYVIRHKGARHFQNPLLNMPFWKVYMLDVLGFILLILLTIGKVLFKIFKLLLSKKDKLRQKQD